MNWKDLRTEFLKYFEKQGHTVVQSSPLIPAQDNTILFANAGMNQFKDVFLGAESREYKRATTIQKCVRAGGKHNDLDQVGFTKRHLTFFEMMGNFSFGDYFKEEAIAFAWTFLTEIVGLDKEKLTITVHTSDFQSKKIWMEKIGIPEEKIQMLGDADNFWQMGDTGPCGPCTEIYYDRGPIENCTKDDQIIEIWNLVFMQFDKQADGSLKPLSKTGVDTGMGFERLVAVVEGKETVFQTEVFKGIMQKIEELSGLSYESADPKTKAAFNVLADHIRSASFIIADGARPSNDGRGYVLRKIIRRALLFSQKLSTKQNLFQELVATLVESYKEFYPYLEPLEEQIRKTIASEADKFFENLQKGQKLFYKIVQDCQKANKTTISGQDAFKLYDTYGFPLEVTRVLAMEHSLNVDLETFELEMEAQKKRSGPTATALETNFNLPEGLVTKFVGYENLESTSKILWIEQQGNRDDCWIAVDTNPFFVATGGQVTDSGTVKIEGQEYKLLEAQSIATGENSKATVLKIEGLYGSNLKLGQELFAKVDQTIRKNTAKNHSVTHLLHSALQNILGKHAKQAGSLVHPDYLRFLFNHPKGLTPEEIASTETLVNQWVTDTMECSVECTSLERAKELGAESIFGEKYNPASVRVVNLGPVSSELCGGTHVKNTGEIGCFKILSESAVGAGVRSIIAVSGPKAITHFQDVSKTVKALCNNFSAKPETLLEQISKEMAKHKLTETKVKELCEINAELLAQNIIGEIKGQRQTDSITLVCKQIDGECDIKLLNDKIIDRLPSSVVFLYKLSKDNYNFVFNAGIEAKKTVVLQDLLQKLKPSGVNGGGRAFVQGTFPLTNASQVQKALEEIL